MKSEHREIPSNLEAGNVHEHQQNRNCIRMSSAASADRNWLNYDYGCFDTSKAPQATQSIPTSKSICCLGGLETFRVTNVFQ